MIRSLLLSATLVLGMTACGKSTSEEAPKTEQAAKKGAKKKAGKAGKKAQAKNGAKKKAGKKGKAGKKAQAKKAQDKMPRVIEGTKYGIGAVNAKNAPDVDALNAKLKNGLKAREAVDAPEGVTVQLIEASNVVINIEPTADGQNIARAWAVSSHVMFPHQMKVGMPMSRHPKVAEMTCTDGDGPLADLALCQVTEGGAISYAVPKADASAEKLKDARIQALVWTRVEKPEAVAEKAEAPKEEAQN